MYRSFPKGRRALTSRINRQSRDAVRLSDVLVASAAVALLGMGVLVILSYVAGEPSGFAAIQNLWRAS